MMNSAILEALNEIDEKKIIRATISNKKNEICNFKKINIRKHYYGNDDAYLMLKELVVE